MLFLPRRALDFESFAGSFSLGRAKKNLQKSIKKLLAGTNTPLDVLPNSPPPVTTNHNK
jgi:hypothetical protein